MSSLVTICIPAWERPKLLVEAVQSCVAQTYTNIEIIISDDSRSDNAPLKIFRGTHRKGLLSAPQIEEIVRAETPVECRVPAGAALMIRPLILHGMSAPLNATHRRVIHLDYAAEDLPYGLEWNQRVCMA